MREKGIKLIKMQEKINLKTDLYVFLIDFYEKVTNIYLFYQKMSKILFLV